MKKLLLFFLAGLIYALAFAANNEQADLYMNLATEKYLQGDYQSSVDSLNKALELDGANVKAKNLLVRVVIDGATDLNLKHEYPAAMKLLKRGKEVAPENEKIGELYQITDDILSGSKKDYQYKRKAEEPPALKMPAGTQTEKIPEPGKKKTQAANPEVSPPEKTPENAQNASVPVKEKAGVIRERPREERKLALGTENSAEEERQPKANRNIPAWFFAAGICIVILGSALVIFIYMKYLRAKLLLEQQFKLEKSRMDFNAALEIEKKKWELQKKEVELEKLRLENKIKEEYEKERKLAPGLNPAINKISFPELRPESRNALMNSEARQLKKTISGATPAGNIYISEANLEDIRDRIASRMQAIYGQSPETAVNFFKEAAKSQDENYKSNIVKALASVAAPCTLDIMFELNGEKSDKVRREVIKSLKQLSKQVKSGQREIPEEYRRRIDSILREEILKGEWVF